MWFQKVFWNPQKPFMTSYQNPKNLISILHTFLVILMKGLPYWLYAEAGWNLASCSRLCTRTKGPVSPILNQKNILVYRTRLKGGKVRWDLFKHIFALFLSLSYICHNISGLLSYTPPSPFPTFREKAISGSTWESNYLREMSSRSLTVNRLLEQQLRQFWLKAQFHKR